LSFPRNELTLNNSFHFAGGQIVDIPELATILVTDQVYRTYKFLCALAKGIPIVSDEWIKMTAKTMKFAEPDRFIVADKEKERRFKFNIRRTLRMAHDKKLLTDYSVFVTPHTKPTPEELAREWKSQQCYLIEG
jgi:Regulator of Ty1 transposition protein 107 BRCT domain